MLTCNQVRCSTYSCIQFPCPSSLTLCCIVRGPDPLGTLLELSCTTVIDRTPRVGAPASDSIRLHQPSPTTTHISVHCQVHYPFDQAAASFEQKHHSHTSGSTPKMAGTAALPKRIIKETERLMAEPYVSASAGHAAEDTGDLTTSSVPGISAVPHDDNLRYFDVKVHGPNQSPYEGQSSYHKPCGHLLIEGRRKVASSSSSSSFQTTIP